MIVISNIDCHILELRERRVKPNDRHLEEHEMKPSLLQSIGAHLGVPPISAVYEAAICCYFFYGFIKY
jgi:hypothetical protein